jgi:hypothetical protein
VGDEVRLQATVAGPGTTGGPLMPCSWEEIVAIVNPPLIAEVEQFARVVPLGELAVQIDLAAEIELEEWRRNPDGFDVVPPAATGPGLDGLDVRGAAGPECRSPTMSRPTPSSGFTCAGCGTSTRAEARIFECMSTPRTC